MPRGYPCPGPSCPNAKSDEFSFAYILIFTVIIAVLVVILCRSNRTSRPIPRSGSSPYGKQSPHPDGSRNPVDSFASSPYPFDRSDVSPGRRRQSPIFSRRTTPRSSPRGLFSVTQ